MSPHILPSQEYLRQCFDYNPKTGEVTWRERPREHFTNDRGYVMWNKRYPGLTITTVQDNGYMRIKVNRTKLMLHRLIWKYVYGDDPAYIDHINRDRSDNRLSNLRAATQHQNSFNRINTPSKAGLPIGVSIDLGCLTKPYRARIQFGGKKVNLGFFSTAEEASASYQAAATKLFGEFKRVA